MTDEGYGDEKSWVPIQHALETAMRAAASMRFLLEREAREKSPRAKHAVYDAKTGERLDGPPSAALVVATRDRSEGRPAVLSPDGVWELSDGTASARWEVEGARRTVYCRAV